MIAVELGPARVDFRQIVRTGLLYSSIDIILLVKFYCILMTISVWIINASKENSQKKHLFAQCSVKYKINNT